MAGRTRKLDKDLITKLSEFVRTGLSNKDAAMACGIAESSFYAWMKKGREDHEADEISIEWMLYWALERAKADLQNDLLASINVAAMKGDWRAAAWLLERRFPEDFGKTQMIRKRTATIEASQQKRIEVHHDMTVHELLQNLNIKLEQTDSESDLRLIEQR